MFNQLSSRQAHRDPSCDLWHIETPPVLVDPQLGAEEQNVYYRQ